MVPAISKTKQIYLTFIICLLFAACTRHKKIDVSNIPIHVKAQRFDQDFDQMLKNPSAKQAAYLQKNMVHSTRILSNAYWKPVE